MINVLTMELRFFNQTAAALDASSAVRRAQTIKESVERRVTKLREWFGKYFDVLDELLSLV